MNEHGFVRKVHDKLRRTKQLRKIWKINDNFQGGVPDAFYLADRELWAEYKYIPTLPKRSTTIVRPDLSELQHGWLDALQKADKQAWVVVGHPQGVWVSDDLEICRRGVACSTMVEGSIPVQDFINLLISSVR